MPKKQLSWDDIFAGIDLSEPLTTYKDNIEAIFNLIGTSLDAIKRKKIRELQRRLTIKDKKQETLDANEVLNRLFRGRGSEVFTIASEQFPDAMVRVKELVRKNVKNAKTLEKIKSDMDMTIATILVVNNLVNITASVIMTYLAVVLFGNIGVGFAIGILTFLLLVFGRFWP